MTDYTSIIGEGSIMYPSSSLLELGALAMALNPCAYYRDNDWTDRFVKCTLIGESKEK